jgi:hypothetical protein
VVAEPREVEVVVEVEVVLELDRVQGQGQGPVPDLAQGLDRVPDSPSDNLLGPQLRR